MKNEEMKDINSTRKKYKTFFKNQQSIAYSKVMIKTKVVHSSKDKKHNNK
jgi:hypothetical protein